MCVYVNWTVTILSEVTMQEFKFLGVRMPEFTMGYGVFLILWATLVSVVSESQSITSWIPSFMGAPILISGILAKVNPERRKVWMHIAVFFGLLSFLGGLDFLRGFSADGGPFAKPYAGASKLMLLVTGGVYTLGCVKSFIWARKDRESNASSEE